MLDIQGERFLLRNTCNLHISFRPLPEGYTYYTPTQADIKQINEEWEYGKSEETEEYLRFIIQYLHKAGIKYKDGTLVAFELEYPHGVVGSLYVKPEHRRKGLAMCVKSSLNRKIMLDGRPVYCFIVKGNDISLELNIKSGFQVVEESKGYRWCHYCPIANQTE